MLVHRELALAHVSRLLNASHPPRRRTGTTHVHNLLAQDPRFGTAKVFHCGFPSAFLWLRPFSWLFAGVLDETRPMDAMAISFDAPCEDELGTNVLSAGCSPYMPISFMRSYRAFRKLYTFEGASGEEFEAWRICFLYFLRKVGGSRLSN